MKVDKQFLQKISKNIKNQITSSNQIYYTLESHTYNFIQKNTEQAIMYICTSPDLESWFISHIMSYFFISYHITSLNHMQNLDLTSHPSMLILAQRVFHFCVLDAVNAKQINYKITLWFSRATPQSNKPGYPSECTLAIVPSISPHHPV